MKKQNLPLLTVLCLLSLFVLAACGGGESAPTSGSSDTNNADTGAGTMSRLETTLNDNYFGESADNIDNPPTWNATAGGVIMLNIANDGALQHNFAIVKQGSELAADGVYTEAQSDILLYDAGLLDAGAKETLRFDAPADPGEYQIICTVAGHYPTMQGKLVVE